MFSQILTEITGEVLKQPFVELSTGRRPRSYNMIEQRIRRESSLMVNLNIDRSLLSLFGPLSEGPHLLMMITHNKLVLTKAFLPIMRMGINQTVDFGLPVLASLFRDNRFI